MDIKTFCDQSQGKWFAQRTTYQLTQSQIKDQTTGETKAPIQSYKAELIIEFLSEEDNKVNELCQKHQINNAEVLGGLKIAWDNSVDWNETKKVGSTLLLFLPQKDNVGKGTFFHQDYPEAQGYYSEQEDNSLLLILQNGTTEMQERLWFASENLRLRTTLIKEKGNYTRAAFYSEIRRLSQN